MTLNDVIHIRGVLQLGEDAPVLIFGDNVRRFDESHDEFIWDDSHEVVYVIKSNVNTSRSGVFPFHIIAVPYEFIQYLEATYSRPKFEKFAANFSSQISDVQLKNIIAKYNPTDFTKLK